MGERSVIEVDAGCLEEGGWEKWVMGSGDWMSEIEERGLLGGQGSELGVLRKPFGG